MFPLGGLFFAWASVVLARMGTVEDKHLNLGQELNRRGVWSLLKEMVIKPFVDMARFMRVEKEFVVYELIFL